MLLDSPPICKAQLKAQLWACITDTAVTSLLVELEALYQQRDWSESEPDEQGAERPHVEAQINYYHARVQDYLLRTYPLLFVWGTYALPFSAPRYRSTKQWALGYFG